MENQTFVVTAILCYFAATINLFRWSKCDSEGRTFTWFFTVAGGLVVGLIACVCPVKTQTVSMDQPKAIEYRTFGNDAYIVYWWGSGASVFEQVQDLEAEKKKVFVKEKKYNIFGCETVESIIRK